MGEWVASGRIVDFVLAVIAAEAVALLAWRRISGRGPSPGALAANLAAGACLLLALRFALTGAPWPAIAAVLALAGAAHVADLLQRHGGGAGPR